MPEEELLKTVHARIAHYRAPREIEFVTAWPKRRSGMANGVAYADEGVGRLRRVKVAGG